MKTLRTAALLVAFAALTSIVTRPAFGQAIATTPQTTISTAQDGVQNYVILTSGTGVVPQSQSTAGTVIVIGRECETVSGTALGGTTTTFPVIRGTCGSATPHPVNSVAWTALSNSGAYIGNDMDGQGGNLTVIPTLPVINTVNGKSFTCLQSGTQTTVNACTWTSYGGTGQTSSLPGVHLYTGGAAPLVTTTGTDTTGISGQVWVSEIVIPATMRLTGVSYLIGSTGGTDKVIVQLFDSLGNVLATSALAGVTVGTSATMQRVPFTAAYLATGPGQYFVGVQTNGTTAKIRTQAFGDHSAGVITQVFGTPVTITPPATFTASSGPVAMLY